jgi:hypothetical protein
VGNHLGVDQPRPPESRIGPGLLAALVTVAGVAGVVALIAGERDMGLASLFLAGAIGLYWWQERAKVRRWDDEHRT